MLSNAVRFTVVISVIAFFLAASEVQAAKGIKKANSNGSHVITGIVTKMTPDSEGGGTFLLKTASGHKKSGVANQLALSGTSQGVELHVSKATRFQNSNGSQIKTAALHLGNHVSVQAIGHDAQTVKIISTHRTSGNFMRHRTSTYHPHSYRPRRR